MKNRQRNQNKYFNSKLGRYVGIPTTKGLFKEISKIGSLRDKALICVLYLTGARVGEIVKVFRINQITSPKTKRGKQWVYFEYLPTQKKRGKMEDSPRTVPILVDTHKDYLKIIEFHINDKAYKGGEKQIDDNAILFDFTIRNAQKIVEKCLGIYPHRLRHIRASNLSREDNFSEAELKRFFNWSTGTTAAHYIHLNTRDLEGRLLDRLLRE